MTRLVLILALSISINARAQLTGFTLKGNPENANGTTWTFQQTINGTVYDLKGILFKPIGTGIFPSVIVNHGTGGNTNPNGYCDRVCKKMVSWGYVCIAVNYTHSGQGAPCGSPGICDPTNWGASNDNYLRAMKCWDILASLSYTDTNCIAAFGHSRGAFLTTGLLGTFPTKYSCAGHTAGGVSTNPGYSAPTTTLAAQITCPYIIHHGDADNTVPIAMDSLLNNVFNSTRISHQFYTYSGYSHSAISQDSLMFSKTKAFFDQHICNTTTGLKNNSFEKQNISIYPNPTTSFFKTNLQMSFDFQVFTLTGQLLFSKNVMPNEEIDTSIIPNGIYIIRIKYGSEVYNQKVIINK